MFPACKCYWPGLPDLVFHIKKVDYVLVANTLITEKSVTQNVGDIKKLQRDPKDNQE